ncbi:MAG: exodeoxyribonuclease VII small subunit [Lachnospiraceae bacterium]|nr:exodeoxyribonuclease VII small subunit [Lachnospiraceae bacterium]
MASAEPESKPKKAKGKKEEAAKLELSLEEAFVKLDELMEQLESGEGSLEESFLLYQQGMQLLKQCNESIDRVEKKLIVLEEEGI